MTTSMNLGQKIDCRSQVRCILRKRPARKRVEEFEASEESWMKQVRRSRGWVWGIASCPVVRDLANSPRVDLTFGPMSPGWALVSRRQRFDLVWRESCLEIESGQEGVARGETASRYMAVAWERSRRPIHGAVGIPWLTVDMEHTHTDIQTAAMMFGAISDAGCVLLARVPASRHEYIKSVLDCAPWGSSFRW